MASPKRTARPRRTSQNESQYLFNWAGKRYVSLGTLIMAFVARPLSLLKNTSGTDSSLPKFEEVQVIFYNFNNKASIMSHCNISQFPVETAYFAREYAKLRSENLSRTVTLSVSEFMAFIASRIVDDTTNPAYGLNDLYQRGENNEVTVRENRQRTFDATMLQRMQEYNIGRHSDFVMPQISFQFDALPVARTDGERFGTILRLHVYDQASSANTSYRELLALGTNNFMNSFSSYPPNTQTADAVLDQQQTEQSRHDLLNNWRELHNTIVNKAISNGLIERISNSSNETRSDGTPQAQETQRTQNEREHFRFVGGPQKLKEYVMRNVPHIIYGAMGTTIKSANLGSQSNAALNSIHMQRSLNASPVLPNGAQTGGVPLTLYPLELTMTSVGCPLLRTRGQEIFIDYNTNTSADNIYIINGFTHKVEAGVFETTLKLIAQDGFGQYRNMISQINTAEATLDRVIATGRPNNTPATNPRPKRTASRRRRGGR